MTASTMPTVAARRIGNVGAARGGQPEPDHSEQPAPADLGLTKSTLPSIDALLLPAARAAALCSVSSATWWRWQAAQRIPSPVRIGATVRWRAEELAAWVEAGCPDRKTWEALREAAQASGRPRQAGR